MGPWTRPLLITMKGLMVCVVIGLVLLSMVSHGNADDDDQPTPDYASVMVAHMEKAAHILEVNTQFYNCDNCSYWCGLHDTEMHEGNAMLLPADESFFKQLNGAGITQFTNIDPDHIYIVECCRVTEFDILHGTLIHGGLRIAPPPTHPGEVDIKVDRNDQMIPEPMGAIVRFHINEIDAGMDPTCEYRYCLINDHYEPCTHDHSLYQTALQAYQG